MKFELFVVSIFFCFYNVLSHTWIDRLTCEDTGEVGYIRNYQGRDQIQDFDLFMTYLLEGRNKYDNICSPHQRENNYYPNYPKLSCPAGSKVQFVYNTNGHTTESSIIGDPRERNSNGGSTETFWAIMMNNQVYPNQLFKLGDVNTNPQFNDESGLINDIVKHQKFNFNDVCDNVSSQACIGEFTIPTNVITNRDYQFVWYWELDRDYMSSGELYTSCFDINITPSSQTQVIPVPISYSTPTVIPCITPSPTPTPIHENCITNP